MGNDYLDTLHSQINPIGTLVALSSATAIRRPNVDMNALESAFVNWQSQQVNSGDSNNTTGVQWKDVTVVVSGASAIDGEPQNVTLYFRPSEPVESTAELTEFKALFWQRQTPGSNQWKLIGDETQKQPLGRHRKAAL